MHEVSIGGPVSPDKPLSSTAAAGATTPERQIESKGHVERVAGAAAGAAAGVAARRSQRPQPSSAEHAALRAVVNCYGNSEYASGFAAAAAAAEKGGGFEQLCLLPVN